MDQLVASFSISQTLHQVRLVWGPSDVLCTDQSDGIAKQYQMLLHAYPLNYMLTFCSNNKLLELHLIRQEPMLLLLHPFSLSASRMTSADLFVSSVLVILVVQAALRVTGKQITFYFSSESYTFAYNYK